MIYQRLPRSDAEAPSGRISHPKIWHNINLFVMVLLFASATINALFLYQRYKWPSDLHDLLRSEYAHLSRDTHIPYMHRTDHDSTNRTLQAIAWDDPEISEWNGFVALDEDQVRAWGLPHSQRWPWDTSKGVYILHSAHVLHCLHSIRTVFNEWHDGVREEEHSWPYAHILHCLNVLRDTTQCNADDTPLYIGRLNANVNATTPKAGIGFPKKCRDWKALTAWSHAHSACYRGGKDSPVDEIERYKFCPDGAQPWLASPGE